MNTELKADGKKFALSHSQFKQNMKTSSFLRILEEKGILISNQCETLD